jgi:hypothetical protein
MPRPWLLATLVACSGGAPVSPAPARTVALTTSATAVEDTDAPGPAVPMKGPPAAPGGAIGTAHPFTAVTASATASWVSFCQARKDTDGDGRIEVSFGHHGDPLGDDVAPYLVIGDGEGQAIDAFVGADAGGRWVAVVRERKLVLVDSWSRKESVLAGADASDDPNPLGPHRAASFDGAGRRVAYLRGGKLRVRELQSGNEQLLDPGSGLVWRFWIDEDGERVWLQMVTRDTDGDGKLALPQAQTSLSARHCRGPWASYGVYGWKGDEPVVRMVAVQKGAVARDVEGALGTLAGKVVRRRADKAIVAEGDGGEVVVAPASCDAEVIHTAKGRLYYVCRATAKRNGNGFDEGPLMVHEGGASRPTGIDVETDGSDEWRARDDLLYGGRTLNAATGTIGTLPSGPPHAVAGDHVLYTPEGHARVEDLASGSGTSLGIDLRGYDDEHQGVLTAMPLRAGSRTAVIDVAAIGVVGIVDGAPPLALANDGHVLVSEAAEADRESMGRPAQVGPLRWRAPR